MKIPSSNTFVIHKYIKGCMFRFTNYELAPIWLKKLSSSKKKHDRKECQIPPMKGEENKVEP